jgi:hypothetical protein
MFWAGDNLFGLMSDCDLNDVGFTAFLMNDADSTVVTSVWHSLVNGGFDQDSDLLTKLVCS